MAYIEKVHPCCRRRIFRKIHQRQDEKKENRVYRKLCLLGGWLKNNPHLVYTSENLKK